jgi:carbon starvation protein
MITEMMVALMAIIAACVLEPGQYFAINCKGTPAEVVARVSASGFPVTESEMATLAHNLGETTMFNRAGGAPTFAVGMAHMFSRVFSSPTALALWYHFAIMFEALFILTTIDAGTRRDQHTVAIVRTGQPAAIGDCALPGHDSSD